MKPVVLVCVCYWLLSISHCPGQTTVVESANRLELQGRFREAEALVVQAILQEPALRPADRKQLEFELDRLERIKKDFPYTLNRLFTELKKSVKGLTAGEYDQWISEGRFESRKIDGQRYFMASSVPNLFFRYPELSPRRVPPKDSTAVDRQHWEACASIRNAAVAQRRPYVLPKRFVVTMTVTAEPNAAPEGQIIRAWLPVPRQYPFQDGINLLSAHPALKHLDDPQSAIRSAYLERPSRKDKPTEFNIQYQYTSFGVRFEVEPERVRTNNPDDAVLKQFTLEAPHVVFTPEIRALSQQIVVDETNPYVKAKKFYDWISEHIKYSLALEYSTIRNISDYCLKNGYGDCGQEALLFMTLCRLNGIPARWQSGWNTFPGAKSNHDWSEIYLAPYGWIPVDPYMGIYAMRYATSLKPQQQREIRDFYFGGLDQYRMAANSDHNQLLTPPKESMRSDDVDFQRGELEWGNHNIYFDQFSYELTAKEIPLPP